MAQMRRTMMNRSIMCGVGKKTNAIDMSLSSERPATLLSTYRVLLPCGKSKHVRPLTYKS